MVDQVTTNEQTSHGHPVHASVHHEEKDINVRAVLVGTAIFVVLSIIMLVGLWAMFIGFRWLDRKLDPENVTAIPLGADEVSVFQPGVEPEVPEFTHHWFRGVEGLEEFERREEEILEEWDVNEATGEVRLPIEEAMDLALERGYPVRESAGEESSVVTPPSWMRQEATQPSSDAPVTEEASDEMTEDESLPAAGEDHR